MLKTVHDFAGRLSPFLNDYHYQPALTEELDAVGPEPFDQARINEIVLWKVNRYAPLSTAALNAINHVAGLRNGEHHKPAKELLVLLEQPGVDLPMASTFLRFRNSRTFQIIDGHAYRALFGKPYPFRPSSRDHKAKVDTYLAYLDALVALAKAENMPFETMDRVLYCLDRAENPPLSARTSKRRT